MEEFKRAASWQWRGKERKGGKARDGMEAEGKGGKGKEEVVLAPLAKIPAV